MRNLHIDKYGEVLIRLGALSDETYERIKAIWNGSIIHSNFVIDFVNGQIVEFDIIPAEEYNVKVDVLLERYNRLKSSIIRNNESKKNPKKYYYEYLEQMEIILDLIKRKELEEFINEERKFIGSCYEMWEIKNLN